MKVIKEQLLTEAPRDGAVPFKMPQSMLNNPNSIDLKGMAQSAKRDADAKAAEEARKRELAANKEKYSELIDRAQAAEEPEKILEVLFEDLVPNSGKADTVAGELVRAMMRLLYRDYNDGDLFYEGYGIETCGSSVAYLIYIIDDLYDSFSRVANRQETDDKYTDSLNSICNQVLNYIFTNDTVWMQNEDDSRGRELERVYEEDYRSDWEPEYDYDFMIPPTIQEYIEAGHIIVDEFIDRVEDALNGNGFIKFDRVEDSWSGYINITGLNRESYDELENWDMYEDSAWEDYIEELRDEYGDPNEQYDEDEVYERVQNYLESHPYPKDMDPEEICSEVVPNLYDMDYEDAPYEVSHGAFAAAANYVEDDEDMDESLNQDSPDAKYKKGDKVKYHGKGTTIMDVENDPVYGVDYLIINPDYDGTNSSWEMIWVGDMVDPI